MSARITDRVFEPDDDASGQNEVPYLLKDLYTVAGLADERGWPVERYDYDAYGKVHMERVAILPWAADFDGDGDVDQNDLTVFLDAYGGSGQASNGPRGWRADLDGDGDVDGSDYVLFADAYNGAGTAPRGDMTLQSGSMATSRLGNPFFFTGRRLDVIEKQDAGTPHHFTDDYAELQLYDYRARTMDPVLGRFLQRDPVGYRDGMGLFGYVQSCPTSRVDPLGRQVTGCPSPPAIKGSTWDFSGIPSAMMSSVFFLFNQPPFSGLRLPPSPDDTVIIGGRFLLDVRQQDSVVAIENSVAARLERGAVGVALGLACRTSDIFTDCGKETAQSDLFTNVWSALGEFKLYWTATCQVGPKVCNVKDPKCSSGCADKAYYYCNIGWEVSDQYDWHPWYNPANAFGVPFNIYGSYSGNASGTVKVCK